MNRVMRVPFTFNVKECVIFAMVLERRMQNIKIMLRTICSPAYRTRKWRWKIPLLNTHKLRTRARKVLLENPKCVWCIFPHSLCGISVRRKKMLFTLHFKQQCKPWFIRFNIRDENHAHCIQNKLPRFPCYPIAKDGKPKQTLSVHICSARVSLFRIILVFFRLFNGKFLVM